MIVDVDLINEFSVILILTNSTTSLKNVIGAGGNVDLDPTYIGHSAEMDTSQKVALRIDCYDDVLTVKLIGERVAWRG